MLLGNLLLTNSPSCQCLPVTCSTVLALLKTLRDLCPCTRVFQHFPNGMFVCFPCNKRVSYPLSLEYIATQNSFPFATVGVRHVMKNVCILWQVESKFEMSLRQHSQIFLEPAIHWCCASINRLALFTARTA